LDARIRIMRLAGNGGISVASNAAVLMATGSFLLMLDNDDELTSDALDYIASAIVADPDIDVIYSDEDKIDPSGQLCDHYHKPDWSPEHLESVMYTLHPLTVRTSLFLQLGGFRSEFSGGQDYDLMLRLSRHTQRIHHIPRILYHWRMIPGSASAEVDAKPAALDAGRRALEQHVEIKYGAARAAVEPGLLAGLYRVRHRIIGAPPVSIMITTNNNKITLPGREPFTMVDNLIDSIMSHTNYPNYRLVVIDNSNSSQEQIGGYQRLGITLHSYGGSMSPFNYSDKANFGLRQLDTEHIVIMNDDMEAFDGDWLSALLEFSQNLEVGACAGKLLHADGTIQHAGVVLGVGGGAAHVYHGFPGDFIGYNGYTHLIRNYSALTAACLATRRSVMAEVGGFDRKLAVDFNDLDVCLRMRERQYRIVYTPFSQLYHFESATAARIAQNPKEVALFCGRWAGIVDNDPYYNPNLSVSRHDFSLR
jgi:GT2 family glycosyltransferase